MKKLMRRSMFTDRDADEFILNAVDDQGKKVFASLSEGYRFCVQAVRYFGIKTKKGEND